MAQIASDYEVHPNQVSQWKRQILEESPQLFANGRTQATSDNDRSNERTANAIEIPS